MQSNSIFFINSLLFGLGLAVEAFMIAVANGLNCKDMNFARAICFAIIFAACHAVALVIGYVIVRTVSSGFDGAEKCLGWIAVGVLALLGVKMIVLNLVKKEKARLKRISVPEFFVQSVVAAFDAFAIGLTVSEYSVLQLAVCATVIAAIIVAAFIVGFTVGKKFGKRFSDKAGAIGGFVFIGISVEIAISACL